MPRVTHFELPADDPVRAAEFYAEVFGWNSTRWEGPTAYWLVSTGPQEQPGIDGGLVRRQAPGQGTVNVVDVPSVDEYAARVERAGGKVVVPKMAIPGVGWLAYCVDTEGNTFGIVQPDAAAGSGG